MLGLWQGGLAGLGLTTWCLVPYGYLCPYGYLIFDFPALWRLFFNILGLPFVSLSPK